MTRRRKPRAPRAPRIPVEPGSFLQGLLNAGARVVLRAGASAAKSVTKDAKDVGKTFTRKARAFEKKIQEALEATAFDDGEEE